MLCSCSQKAYHLVGKTKVKQIKLPIEEQCDEEIKECGDGLGRAAPAGGGCLADQEARGAAEGAGEIE